MSRSFDKCLTIGSLMRIAGQVWVVRVRPFGTFTSYQLFRHRCEDSSQLMHCV